jgi:hypothetical protein
MGWLSWDVSLLFSRFWEKPRPDISKGKHCALFLIPPGKQSTERKKQKNKNNKENMEEEEEEEMMPGDKLQFSVIYLIN